MSDTDAVRRYWSGSRLGRFLRAFDADKSRRALCSGCFRQHDATHNHFSTTTPTRQRRIPRDQFTLQSISMDGGRLPAPIGYFRGHGFFLLGKPGNWFFMPHPGTNSTQWMNCLSWTFSGRLGICMVYTAPWVWRAWILKDGRSEIALAYDLTTATKRWHQRVGGLSTHTRAGG